MELRLIGFSSNESSLQKRNLGGHQNTKRQKLEFLAAMNLPKLVKIVHLPASIGGNAACLSAHLNKCGLRSESWAVTSNFYGYPTDFIIAPSAKSPIFVEWKKLFAMRYIWKFDAIIFNYGSTLFSPLSASSRNHKSVYGLFKNIAFRWYLQIMQLLECFLLQVFNRVIMVQYKGDDARQGEFCRLNFSINATAQVSEDYYTKRTDRLKKEQISLFSRKSDKIYALNPDLLHVLPKSAEFLPYSHISLEEWTPNYTQSENQPLRIGHAPSHRGVKGTQLIIKAAENLKRRGFHFEFILVEGFKNRDAKMIYRELDVLVDQLFIGWYGGVAVEAMALGKPVLAYIRENDLKYIPSEMKKEMPIIRTTPDNIENSLEQILHMPRNIMVELAKKSRAYVERWHDPVKIAGRIKKDIEEALAAKKRR